MAFAHVQTIGGGASTSGQSSFGSTATSFTAGNLLAAVITWTYTGAGASVTVNLPTGWTDSGVGTKNNGAPSSGTAVHYLPNNAGGSQTWTWTATANGGGTLVEWAYTIVEFSGAATVSPLDLASVGTATGASASTVVTTSAASGTTKAADLLFAGYGLSRSTIPTLTASASSVPTSGWTVDTQFKGSSASTPHAASQAMWQVLGAATTATNPVGIATASTTVSNQGLLLTFKLPSAAVTLNGSTLSLLGVG